MNEKLRNKVKESMGYMVEKRRYFHENPEISDEEFETARDIKAELKSMGLPIFEVEGTGFYSVLDTGKPGKTIGLRTDMDALPIEESEMNLSEKKVCVSKNKGCMHACGHDAHMAIMLGAARVLNDIKEELRGKIVFIFEASEELAFGINHMIEGIKHIKFDAIYGTHVTSFMDVGKVSASPGPVMAGLSGISIVVKGKAGHGSRPDKAISPIFAGANIVTNLATAWVNQLDVTKTTTLGLGKFISGTADNIIPSEALIEGTVRFYDESNGLKALELVKSISENVAMAHNCSVELDTEKNSMILKPVVNDEKLANLAEKCIEEAIPGGLLKNSTWFASETFSIYSQLAPIVLAFAGIRNSKKGIEAEHHNEHFDLDEDVLYYASLSTVKFTFEFLSKE